MPFRIVASLYHIREHGALPRAALKEFAMSTLRRIAVAVLLVSVFKIGAILHAQGVTPAASATSSAWTVKVAGEIRWQQVTPAGALLVSTDNALSAIDIEGGRIVWEKPDLGGLPPESVRPVEGSLLIEASRPGLLLIFDPVSGGVVFDSRRLGLAKIITRRVLPQSGTLLVHGQRESGPAAVALYDLATGQQLWINESLFTPSEPKRRGFGALMQGLVRIGSEGTELQVLQAGPELIVVHTLMGLRALEA